MKITGIIMAGGKSSRMGKDKGLMIYNDKPLVSYPLSALKDVCDEIIISTNNDEYSFLGYPLIKDEIPEIGPIGGLYSSLKASKNEWNLIVACDMPFVSKTFLSELISQITNKYDAYVPQNDKKQYEALCALYSKTCIPHIERRINSHEYGLYQLLNNIILKKIQVSEDNRNFINLNTLDEFKQIKKGI